MFARLLLRVSDLDASEAFYRTVLSKLGLDDWQEFELAPALDHRLVTKGLHVGFVAPARARVGNFWRAGTEAGHRDDGAPGPRPEYGDDYYGGFLLDPDGNSAEAAHHDTLREGGVVDHIWIRVQDLEASRRFYAAVGPRAGFELNTDTPERAQFQGESGSFSLVAGGTPTRHMHLGFAADETATLVDPDGNTIELAPRS
jgi:catechol 2,3-dioxygenase-like lactoylglutathione lyase family enzyme